jgi:hypothetical protein
MKNLSFLLIIITCIGCDPYGFGFKKNPAYVLDESLKAINNLDVQSFLEVTEKEALCVYGNDPGLAYLKDRVVINTENVKVVPKVLEAKYFMAPRFVGYWSYYHERYQVDIQDKGNAKLLFKAYVDCEYGFDAEKNSKYINLPPKKYKMKECRLIKVAPETFSPLPIPEKCSGLQVNVLQPL